MIDNIWIDSDTGLKWYLYEDETLYRFNDIPEFEDEMEGFGCASLKQMMTLLDYTNDTNGVFKESVPFKCTVYWSSTPMMNNPDNAWTVDVVHGRIYQSGIINKRKILVVSE